MLEEKNNHLLSFNMVRRGATSSFAFYQHCFLGTKTLGIFFCCKCRHPSFSFQRGGKWWCFILLKTKQTQGEQQNLELCCNALHQPETQNTLRSLFSMYFQENKPKCAESTLAVPAWGWNQCSALPCLSQQSQSHGMLNTWRLPQCSAGGISLPLPKFNNSLCSHQQVSLINLFLLSEFSPDPGRWAAQNSTCKEGKS